MYFMDTKVTLRFNADIIERAKQFAESNNMSLSRLTEVLYQRLTAKNYSSIEEIPLADWVNAVAEGETEYQVKRKSRKQLKEDYYNAKKK